MSKAQDELDPAFMTDDSSREVFLGLMGVTVIYGLELEDATVAIRERAHLNAAKLTRCRIRVYDEGLLFGCALYDCDTQFERQANVGSDFIQSGSFKLMESS